MKMILSKIRFIYQRIKAYFPSPLPRGMKEFESWANLVLELAKAPNNDSTKFALAVQIMHLGPTEANKPKEYFIRALQKGMSTQIANAVMHELKEKQKAEQAAAEAARQAALNATQESKSEV